MASYTPNRTVSKEELYRTMNASGVLERSLILNKKRSKLKESLVWCGVNAAFLAIVVYDITQTCPWAMGFYHYFEYSLTVVFSLNVLYYLARMIRLYFSCADQIAVTAEQKKLLGVPDADPNYTLINSAKSPVKRLNSFSSPQQSMNLSGFSWTPQASPGQDTTPMNMTALSWRSFVSPNQSLNYSTQSPSWGCAKRTENGKQVSFQNVSSMQHLEDDDEELAKQHPKPDDGKITQNNLLSSFWSHPITQTSKDMSSFLRKNQYQLSTQSTTKHLSGSPSGNPDDKSSGNVTALEVWTRINVDTVALTQWNENLRMWLSQTILERLVKEFDLINSSLEKHNMSDFKIGNVSLDRLRKTALTVGFSAKTSHFYPRMFQSQVAHFIPSMSTILPFLELHANQQYLTKRIRELSRGGCMSEFKWNGGSKFNGKEWDESLPTDCTIIMHLLSCYLDTQLMPSPNLPDTKAFSGHYYVKATDKMPALTPNSLFIQEVSEKPPHYRVIVGEQIYEMVKGYNNLFHSIVFFIYHVNKLEQGMLGRVNLGRAGVNMLWIIGQKE
uniref:Transmembrane protein 209 n=2 Tax=Dendroctonus ponderosae TaxID=77166 RepID=A0AAR5Q954_DENPD